MYEPDDQDHVTIIGLDIGDGESSLAYLKPSNVRDPKDLAEIYERKRTGERSIVTALAGPEATGRRPIGEEAVSAAVSAGATQFSLNFKHPSQPHITPNTFLFAEALLDEFFRDTGIPREECVVYIGHPTGWAADAVDAYKAQFRKLDVPVELMPESHSALIHARDRRAKGNPWPDVALVIDIGSSTTDCTLVKDMKPDNLAVGSTLGCQQIDQKLKGRVEVGLKDKAFQDALTLDGGQELLLLACRRAKEAHFARTEPEKMWFRDKPIDPKFDPITDRAYNWIQVDVNGGIVDKIVDATDGWKQQFRDVLTEVRTKADDKLPKLIIVSGGGSRMPFVRDVVREIFPNAEIENDQEPSFSVARGLASNGRHRINIDRFHDEVAAISQDPAIETVAEDCVNGLVKEIKEKLSRLKEADPAAAMELAKSINEGRAPEDLIDRYRHLYYLNRAIGNALSARTAEACRRYGVEDHTKTFDVQFPRLMMDNLITMVSEGFHFSMGDPLMKSGLRAAAENGPKLADHLKSRLAARKMREISKRQWREADFDVYYLNQSPSYNKLLLAGGAAALAAAIGGGIWLHRKFQPGTDSTHFDIDSLKVGPDEMKEFINSVREQVRDELTRSAEEIEQFLA
jgi:hypothetical protein